jgi:hypothetical protein
MFETLFKYPRILARHRGGPASDERQRFSAHRAHEGAARSTLRGTATEVLIIAKYIDVINSNAIGRHDLEAAALSWARHQRSRRRSHGPRWSRELFLRVGTSWLRFLGRWQETKPRPSPVAGLIKDFADYMLEERDIPVIFLTGKTETDDETRGFEVGAVDYIHKPFSPAVVKARVHTHLVLREAREQLARQLLSINSELEMAREIQMSILPHEIPRIKGLEIAARYLPMTSVAGDFYDFIVVDEKQLGILVADVSGHGLPAALIASMLKAALSAQSAHACDPARVLGD